MQVPRLPEHGNFRSLQWLSLAWFSYDSTGLVVTNCTFYNIISMQQKDTTQDAVVSYCYMDLGVFGNNSGTPNYGGAYFEGITGTGRQTKIHHNIMLGGMYLSGGNVPNYTGDYEFFNNNTVVPFNLSNPIFLPASAWIWRHV